MFSHLVPEQQQDTVFVSGLPDDVTEEEIASHFGAIGLIKIDKKTNRPKIWVYKDKVTGRGKGEVTVTYDDPPTASSAIEWFNRQYSCIPFLQRINFSFR